jgi:glycosyltransferase involved in cell wall biosynthesis
MFSIIIPLYNKASYIEKAIRSVIDQSFSAFELIIVNDGSTDESLEVVEKFKDPRIRLINQENAGVSKARNNGVEKAENNYISFLDADDYWNPHYLAEMQKLISLYPDAGLWASKYYKVKHGRNIEANIKLEEGFSHGYINYFRAYEKTMWMPLYPCSVVIPKPIFKEYDGFNPNLKLGEDFHLWSRIALKYRVAYLNKPLVYYNQDVDIQHRAIGSLRLWNPRHHYLFNLEELELTENENPDIKKLLNKMRLHALLRYRLSKAYPEAYKDELKKIDFSRQLWHWRLKYHVPVNILRGWFALKRWGSMLKTKIIKLAR